MTLPSEAIIEIGEKIEQLHKTLKGFAVAEFTVGSVALVVPSKTRSILVNAIDELLVKYNIFTLPVYVLTDRIELTYDGVKTVFNIDVRPVITVSHVDTKIEYAANILDKLVVINDDGTITPAHHEDFDVSARIPQDVIDFMYSRITK